MFSHQTLMGALQPAGQLALCHPFLSWHCGYYTCFYHSCPPLSGCHPYPTWACGHSVGCPFGSLIPQSANCPDPNPLGPYTDLATLKAQLKEQLRLIEVQEQALAEASKPKTVEDAAAMEKELTAKLENLRAHKAALERGAGGQKK